MTPGASSDGALDLHRPELLKLQHTAPVVPVIEW